MSKRQWITLDLKLAIALGVLVVVACEKNIEVNQTGGQGGASGSAGASSSAGSGGSAGSGNSAGAGSSAGAVGSAGSGGSSGQTAGPLPTIKVAKAQSLKVLGGGNSPTKREALCPENFIVSKHTFYSSGSGVTGIDVDCSKPVVKLDEKNKVSIVFEDTVGPLSIKGLENGEAIVGSCGTGFSLVGSLTVVFNACASGMPLPSYFVLHCSILFPQFDSKWSLTALDGTEISSGKSCCLNAPCPTNEESVCPKNSYIAGYTGAIGNIIDQIVPWCSSIEILPP